MAKPKFSTSFGTACIDAASAPMTCRPLPIYTLQVPCASVMFLRSNMKV